MSASRSELSDESRSVSSLINSSVVTGESRFRNKWESPLNVDCV